MLIGLIATTLIAVSPQEARMGRGKASVSDLSFRIVDTRTDGAVRELLLAPEAGDAGAGVGTTDHFVMRVTCAKGAVASASLVGAGQISAITGGAVAGRTGGGVFKGREKGFRAGATAPAVWQTRAVGKVIRASYDLATMKGARTSGTAVPVTVAQADAAAIVCAT
ncbi:hypothetical protein K9B35_02350 [Sphingomonas sp. R647]|uniref:hypothetical protein n=1 Tax=Sphingomonas sp. R647 TaxID=2875233 RepID=UPI001CD7A93F|nr:hypothetical protein [Sphingomonas sp. R647]MCA1196797.1 hypothetical protein [Sphingomonas sp. R647]